MAKQLQKKHWTPGIKQGIAFSNLESIKKYEPGIYALFKQPLEEGARVTSTDGKYDYKLRHSARFGWGVTRFEKTNTVSYGSTTTITKEPPQPRPQSAGTVEYQQRMARSQQLNDILNTLEQIRRLNSLVVSVQQQMKEQAAQ